MGRRAGVLTPRAMPLRRIRTPAVGVPPVEEGQPPRLVIMHRRRLDRGTGSAGELWGQRCRVSVGALRRYVEEV